MNTNAIYEYTVPSDIKPKTLKAEAWVRNHTKPNEKKQAHVWAEILGWDGSKWVLLAKSKTLEAWGHEERTVVVSYTIPNIDNQYSRYQFKSCGNSFNRTVTGYLTEYYQK